MHTYIRTYVRTYEHTYVHAYIHTYVRTYIHTHTGFGCGSSDSVCVSTQSLLGQASELYALLQSHWELVGAGWENDGFLHPTKACFRAYCQTLTTSSARDIAPWLRNQLFDLSFSDFWVDVSWRPYNPADLGTIQPKQDREPLQGVIDDSLPNSFQVSNFLKTISGLLQTICGFSFGLSEATQHDIVCGHGASDPWRISEVSASSKRLPLWFKLSESLNLGV